MKEQNTIEIDVFQLLKTLWKRKLIILLVALVTGAGAFAYSTFIVKPEYTDESGLAGRILSGKRLPRDYPFAGCIGKGSDKFEIGYTSKSVS